MTDLNLFTIKFVSAQTGLKPHLIRIWERRYKVVEPRRNSANHRLYRQADIQRLVLLKRAVSAGHRISQIAPLPNEALARLLAPYRVPAARAERSEEAADLCRQLRRRCWRAVQALDPDALEAALDQAVIRLSRRQLVEEVITPLFVTVGESWSSGRLKIINEHMATQYARGVLLDLLRGSDASREAPRLVIGTPTGQLHELGAICVALAAAEAGWRPLYIGSSLPAEELAAAASDLQARALALSITYLADDRRLGYELTRLRRFVGPQFSLLIGGRQAALLDGVLDSIRARRIDSWREFKEVLFEDLAA